MAEISKYVFQQWFDDAGAPLNAGTVTVYDAGTSNLSSIYSDQAETAMANPFTLTSTGRVATGQLFLGSGTYDLVIKNSAGTTIDTADDVAGSVLAASLTAGSVLFADANGSITQDNASLFWDDTNNRLGLGDAAPGTQLDIAGTTPYLTLHNTTEEDIDNGRESLIIFEGEQSGGELTQLAKIQASHDGTSDDQKGDLIFFVNDGDDGTSPTEVLRLESDGNIKLKDTSSLESATEMDLVTPIVGVGDSTSDAIAIHFSGAAEEILNVRTASGANNAFEFASAIAINIAAGGPSVVDGAHGFIFMSNATPTYPMFKDNNLGSSYYFGISDGTTGGAVSAGAGNQYVELNINGTTYKVLHDGTV